MKLSPQVIRRRKIQWFLVPIVIITIALGWKYPFLGFAVPVVMLTGMIGGLWQGRYVCGNLCPRGSFFDRIIFAISLHRKIPLFVRKMPLRWMLFAAMMAFIIFRISQNVTDWKHWGYTFWLMCVITTGISIILGILLHPRTWCAFCTMGTIQNALGGNKHQLIIDSALCKSCRACEKVCPIQLSIVQDKNKGVLTSRDCLKCPECIGTCPVGALSWPQKP